MERVSIGEIKLLQGSGVLAAYGLGSCIGLFLYDATRRLGGLAHIMLAGAAPENFPYSKTKYAENAIGTMVDEMKRAGAQVSAISAVLAGGAHMFQEGLEARPSIGVRNIQGVYEILKRYNIRVVAEDTGGDYGRTMEASVESGAVLVKSFRFGVKKLV